MIHEDPPIILIVDDMPINIKILADALRHDYRIKVTSHGQDALERARIEPHPDLILLDVMMPDLDGYEVCRRLKADPLTQSIPVIFVTAKDGEADQELGFNLGGVDYITKPFSIPIVRARVRLHIQLKRQAEMLGHLPYIDPLTGIPNRRQFEDSLERECQRASRETQPLSLLMIDIDHFKDYNDQYGHGAGDEALRRVAAVLARQLERPGELAARYGGEEFVAILPSTDQAGAGMLAERLREGIQRLELPHTQSRKAPVLTVSIGGATAAPDRPAESPETLVQRADRMLYRAKEAGRNRTLMEEPGGSGA